jgi:WD40 repeat protein
MQLLRQSGTLRQTAVRFADRLDPDQRDRTLNKWGELTSQYRNEAVRWLSLTSLRQVRKISFTTSTTLRQSSGHAAMSPDGKRLATSQYDPRTRQGQIRLLDSTTGNVHDPRHRELCCTIRQPQGRKDKDGKTVREIRLPVVVADPRNAFLARAPHVACSPDGKWLVVLPDSRSRARSLSIFDLSTSTKVSELTLSAYNPYETAKVAFHPNTRKPAV